ncbi:hypothetical protein UFOVP247_96 [uncultured Caudovirales phage]|uniref:Uncharacterized protein n=1 Tax=uncultured Caudovirales phage TaxID=2100421 RepID=A0A6J7WWX3_9CAUD|nr:hypothetical protein UFOVP247_96 [uncultured Caudovirales phage]
MIQSANPFSARIIDVEMAKFNGADKMSIMPQVVEVVIYQSVFSPVMRATLAVHDLVNLIGNYPISGEESITITLDQDSEDKPYSSTKRSLKFIISGIEKLTADDAGRSMTYLIQLDSFEAYVNAKTKISHAYKDSVEEIIKSILQDYLKTDKKFKLYSDTKKSRDLVVPNMRPFAAIKWLCKFAVSAEPEKYYNHVFYESMNATSQDMQLAREPGGGAGSLSGGFIFKALQKPVYRGAVDDSAYSAAQDKPYYYLSNIEAVRNSPELYKNLQADGFAENRAILNLKYNKRFAGLEKIIGGYMENEYVEINLLQKDHKITRTTVKEAFNPLGIGLLNTSPYIDDVINHDDKEETSGRVRYEINNYDDLNQPSLRDKFGRSIRSTIAFNQLDFYIGVHTDFNFSPGDLIYLKIADIQGFNGVEQDKYISGYFIITEIKNIIRPSGETSTVLRVNKDSYNNGLFQQNLLNPQSPAVPSFGGGVR